MRYQVTAESRPVLADVLRLIQETRRLLAFADASTNARWDNMRNRFPSGEDLRQGFVSLSSAELENVKLQLQTFRVQASGYPHLVAPLPEASSPASAPAPRPQVEAPAQRRSSPSMPVARPAMVA